MALLKRIIYGRKYSKPSDHLFQDGYLADAKERERIEAEKEYSRRHPSDPSLAYLKEQLNYVKSKSEAKEYAKEYSEACRREAIEPELVVPMSWGNQWGVGREQLALNSCGAHAMSAIGYDQYRADIIPRQFDATKIIGYEKLKDVPRAVKEMTFQKVFDFIRSQAMIFELHEGMIEIREVNVREEDYYTKVETWLYVNAPLKWNPEPYHQDFVVSICVEPYVWNHRGEFM